MKRTAVAWLMLAAVGGCSTTDSGRYIGEQANSAPPAGCRPGGQTVPGVQGPWGQPVAMAAPYSATRQPSGAAAAQAMINQSMPLDLVQQVSYKAGKDAGSGLMLAQGTSPVPPPPGAITPPGVPAMPGAAAGMPGMPGMPGMMPPGMGGMPPGMMPPGMGGMPPGMGGPGGPGGGPPGYPPGVVAAIGAIGSPGGPGGPAGPGGPGGPFQASRTSVRFVGPTGMKVSWYAPTADGKKAFSATPLEVPGRYNFVQGAIYRLKLSDIAEFPQMDLYPTLEVVPGNSRTSTFLAHSSVPVSFTPDDLRMVATGNYLVKVIYLPDPHFQDVAVSGTDELVSTQLEPGVDPIAEACRRGSILLVIRLGNIDLEARHTPPIDAPPPGSGPMLPPPGVTGPRPDLAVPGAGLAPRVPGLMPSLTPGGNPDGAAGGPPAIPGTPAPGGAGPAGPNLPGLPGLPGPGSTGRLPDLRSGTATVPVSATSRPTGPTLTPAQLAGQPGR